MQQTAANSAQSSQIAFSLLCIGLDNSGKTTLCRNLTGSSRLEILPTPNMEIHYINISKLGKPCLVYDLSGNGRHRDNWKVFFAEVQAILYVVDASDSEDRFKLQKLLIEDLLNDDIIKRHKQPIMFLLNKQDKENTYEKDELIKDLGLDNRKCKNKVFFKETSGFNGQGLKDAIEQIADCLFTRKIQ